MIIFNTVLVMSNSFQLHDYFKQCTRVYQTNQLYVGFQLLVPAEKVGPPQFPASQKHLERWSRSTV